MTRILIIDDDTEVRELIRRVLAKAGYEVFEAPNGKIGLELYGQVAPDIVITDMLMPEMEGAETIIRIRSEYLDAKIIAISGGNELIDGSVCLQVGKLTGAVTTLPKPFAKEEILKAVRDLVQK